MSIVLQRETVPVVLAELRAARARVAAGQPVQVFNGEALAVLLGTSGTRWQVRWWKPRWIVLRAFDRAITVLEQIKR